MRYFAIALLLLLPACTSINAKPDEQASSTAVAAANTGMLVAKVVSKVQTIDCTTAADAPTCVNAVVGDTNDVVQGKTTTCLTTIAVNTVLTTMQRQICSRVGLSVPAVK
jgi:hypothetical protein